jgi:hypothetical protein
MTAFGSVQNLTETLRTDDDEKSGMFVHTIL